MHEVILLKIYNRFKATSCQHQCVCKIWTNSNNSLTLSWNITCSVMDEPKDGWQKDGHHEDGWAERWTTWKQPCPSLQCQENNNKNSSVNAGVNTEGWKGWKSWTTLLCHAAAGATKTRAKTWQNQQSMRPAKTLISLGIHPVWSESSLSAWRNLGSLATQWMHSEDSDQTGWMPRLIWVFAGRTHILLVLSCRSSHCLFVLWLNVPVNNYGHAERVS